jgi:quercetin dioxygenase-like cupin family protein
MCLIRWTKSTRGATAVVQTDARIGIVREGGVEAVEAIDTCLEVRRSARAHAVATIRTLLVSAVSLLVTTGVSSAADPDIISGKHDGVLAAVISELPPDHPIGTKATVTLVSFKRALRLDEPFLSTFIVDYLPGGSTVLHRSPAAGYVLVHVLSGTIRAQAWETGIGTYRSGQTWVEPAVANDITAKNASAVEPARALVVLITNEMKSLEPEDQ